MQSIWGTESCFWDKNKVSYWSIEGGNCMPEDADIRKMPPDQQDGGGVEIYLDSQNYANKNMSIFKAVQEQQRTIWYQVYVYMEAFQ